MRDNPDYLLDDPAAIAELIRANPWCTFVSHDEEHGLVASHYPVLIDEDADGPALLSHVGRPDEAKHGLGRREILAIVYGPSGYISPSWYGIAPAVPTWNFAVVHAYGTPEILDDAENLAVLERLVDQFESPLPNPFRMRSTLENAAYAERIVHGTVGFRLRIERVEAKNKMSQDKPDAVVDRIVAALREPGPYANGDLARAMTSARVRPPREGTTSR